MFDCASQVSGVVLRPVPSMCRRLCWTIWNGISRRCSPPRLIPCLLRFPRLLLSQSGTGLAFSTRIQSFAMVDVRCRHP